MFANTGQTVQLCKQSELSGENSVRVPKAALAA